PDKTYKELTFNKDKDWVTSFKNRKGCIESYEYEVDANDPNNHYYSVVTKKCGQRVTNRSKYEFWNKENRSGTAKFLFRVRSDVNGNITDITYHEVFGKPISILKNLAKTTYSYYDNGLVKTKNENLISTSFEYNQKCS